MEPKSIEAWAKLFDAVAWPLVAIVVGFFLVRKLPEIGKVLKRMPLIRKIGFQGFEVELDLDNINELQEQTDRALMSLIHKADQEIQRSVSLASIKDVLSIVSDFLFENLPNKDATFRASGKLRCTIHVKDVVFSEYLYQASNYYYPWTKIHQSTRDRTSGRRFSLRYGIIGRAVRMLQSQLVGNALQGNDEEIQNLISHWSMNLEEAKSAKSKPSCLALVLCHPDNKKFLGVFYADAEIENYFGEEKYAEKFFKILDNSKEFLQLKSSLYELSKILSQFDVEIDLSKNEK